MYNDSLSLPSLPHLHTPSDGGEVCIIERLFSSSLVAIVEMCNPRKLRVCHFKVQSVIGPMSMYSCRVI